MLLKEPPFGTVPSYAGPEEVIGDQEFWADVHYGVGVTLGLVGIDETSALTLMEVWEITEPGIWSFWGYRVEYQGRNNFEGGEEGIRDDIEDGMDGYEIGSGIWIWLWPDEEEDE